MPSLTTHTPAGAAGAVVLFLIALGSPAALEAAAEEPVVISDGSVCVASPRASGAPSGDEETGIPDLVKTVRLETMDRPADADCETPDPPCQEPNCRVVECRRCVVTVTYFLPDNPKREFAVTLRKPLLGNRTNLRVQGRKFGDFEKVGPRRHLRLRDAKIRRIEVQGQPTLECGDKPCRVKVSFETTQ